MGFVITFPGSTMKRRLEPDTKRQTTAEIMIFPGVRYERYTRMCQSAASQNQRADSSTRCPSQGSDFPPE
jgi:hypothetical protein